MDSARGVATIVVFCRNILCTCSCDAIVRTGLQTMAFFLLFRVQQFVCNTSREGTFQKCFTCGHRGKLGTENAAQCFPNRSFWKSLRVMDVRAFGSWMSAPKCLISRILTALTEGLGQDIRANDPRMSAGCPSQQLSLWADFLFLTSVAVAPLANFTPSPNTRTISS